MIMSIELLSSVGSRCNAQRASHNDARGEGEGGIMMAGPPAESDRAGRPRSYLVGESPLRSLLISCAKVPFRKCVKERGKS